MTDRNSSDSNAALEEGASPVWGGGRFQARFFGGLGAPGDSAVFGWSTIEYVLSNSSADVVKTMGGSAAEPSTLKQFKAYMTFFEEDSSNAADFDLDLWTHNCTGSSSTNRLKVDDSWDVKSMVRDSDSAVAGQQLCNKIRTLFVPSGQSRRVQLFQYYSDAKGLR